MRAAVDRRPTQIEERMALVEVEREGAVAHVWLNRPEAHNALAAELGTALVETLRARPARPRGSGHRP